MATTLGSTRNEPLVNWMRRNALLETQTWCSGPVVRKIGLPLAPCTWKVGPVVRAGSPGLLETVNALTRSTVDGTKRSRPRITAASSTTIPLTLAFPASRRLVLSASRRRRCRVALISDWFSMNPAKGPTEINGARTDWDFW